MSNDLTDKQDETFLIAVAGSSEGRHSRATDGDDSSLGNIGEEEEEEEEDSDGDYIELPAVTKPVSQNAPTSNGNGHDEREDSEPVTVRDTAKQDVLLKKGDPPKKEVKDIEEKNKVRGRSNSLFKILGRRQKLVEEAEQKRDKERLQEGEVWNMEYLRYYRVCKN
jgi:hypothetical protein